ncbi:MAG: ABC transporter permease, partial [Candidatus Cloacimonetes bacterium]|nr:ABC transporter permease [Candidatus Cloacimonadota bacterium]
GVAAVVTMFSTVYGIKELITRNVEKMGWNNSIVVFPIDGNSGTPRRGQRRHWRMQRTSKPLRYSDFETLREQIPHKYIYGEIEEWRRLQTTHRRKWARLKAVNKEFFDVKTYPILHGRYYNQFEERKAVKVCVIGYIFMERYFPGEIPIGKKVTVGGLRYRIIGVLAPDALSSNGFNFNTWERQHDLTAVYIPLSTGAKYLRKSKTISTIYMQADRDADYSAMKNQVQQTLLAQHKMAHDFQFEDVGAFMLKMTKELDEFMHKWNITLSAIASISLLVGGIGLFSTLLISINEKMLEIGIRKSVGASEGDIFVYFLIESVTLALAAAVTGIILSNILILIVAKAAKTSFPMPIEGILLGLSFALIIGILSGLYPAIKASRLDPIKAIFYNE